MNRYRKIQGERLYLSPLSVDDAPLFTRWFNDPEVAIYLNALSMAISEAGERTWIEKNDATHVYSIILEQDDRPIGNVGLHNLSLQNRCAEIGIVIGEKDCWGQGLGKEAMALILGYAFDCLDMESIMLIHHPWNPRGRAAYESLGFQEIGVRRKALRFRGRSWDIPMMDITAEDFRSGPWARFRPSLPEE